MGKAIRLAALGLFISGIAAAGPCAPGTLEDYINLGATGCSQGGYTFRDFVALPGIFGAIEVSPTLVLVTPGGNAQLEFQLDQSAIGGELYQSFFRFTALGALASAEIRLNEPEATVDGAVTGILDICADGYFPGNTPQFCGTNSDSIIAAHIDGFSFPLAQTVLPVSSFFDVFADLTVDGGLDGSASLRSATIAFGEGDGGTAIPEPAPALLVVAGLGVVCAIRRRHGN